MEAEGGRGRTGSSFWHQWHHGVKKLTTTMSFLTRSVSKLLLSNMSVWIVPSCTDSSTAWLVFLRSLWGPSGRPSLPEPIVTCPQHATLPYSSTRGGWGGAASGAGRHAPVEVDFRDARRKAGVVRAHEVGRVHTGILTGEVREPGTKRGAGVRLRHVATDRWAQLGSTRARGNAPWYRPPGAGTGGCVT